MARRSLTARWLNARIAERYYGARLAQVSRQIQALIQGMHPDGTAASTEQIVAALKGYAGLLAPWAASVANHMIADVSNRDARSWFDLSKEMGNALKKEIMGAPIGGVYRALMQEQVVLIKSLPLEAAQRVHQVTEQGFLDGRRAESIVKDILATGEVSHSRAKTIARTEVSRTSEVFTQARATFVGSPGYIWRSSKDGAVRPTHLALEGKFIRWDDPPKTDKGLAPYHAGCGPNCRCYAEPVIPQ